MGLNTEVNDYLRHANEVNSSKWTFTSVSRHMWDGKKNERRETKVTLSVLQPHRGCSSASPWLSEQGSPAFPLCKNLFPVSAWCEKSKNKWVLGSTCFSRREWKCQCWVLGLCAWGSGRAAPCSPRDPNVACDCRGIAGSAGPAARLHSNSWGYLINCCLSCFVPLLQAASITEF